jgi:microcin C transport system permease protein
MYVLKRIFLAIPTLVCLSLLCFALFQWLPGSPLDSHWGTSSTFVPRSAPELVKNLGLDQPLGIRYGRWVTGVFGGNWGDSFYYGEPVLSVIGRALPVSLFLGFAVLFVLYFFAVPIGVGMVFSRSVERVFSTLLILYAIPHFILGLILLALLKDFFPLQKLISDNFSELSLFQKGIDLLWHATLPVLSYVISLIPPTAILIGNALKEELTQDYLVAAKAKGLSTWHLISRHASKGVLFVIATSLGREIAYLLSGTLFIEVLFGISGIGKLAYDSLLRRDTPVLMGIILLMGTLQILGNAVADILYRALNPKVRYQ